MEAAMLAVFYGRASPLDPLWHVRHLGTRRLDVESRLPIIDSSLFQSGLTPGSRYSPFFLANAKLLHWSGHFKPWKPSRNALSLSYEQKLWDKYFLRDPTGKFRPIRNKNTRDM